MTSIEQLQICGIRSFDPDPSNKQTVYFQKPLTVILGKNGAGKTTIIEALLNACTGSMPPGSGTEKSSFVYDPKVMGESEVKAQIRLIFTGKGGKVMQVIRSFQASRNRNRLTFATLDNTVAFQDTATGKVVSHTYRANDVDRVVPEMLGVSSAVLEHVIFCHQEECNWPLAPPKDVKRIFDDIFAATRYVLALDRLRENNKELRRQQKEHEASLMALREHRDQAQQLEEDITRKEELVKTIQSRNVSIDPELRELRNVSASLDSVEQNVDALTREAAQVQGRMDEKRDAIRRAAIPPCDRTLEEMQEMRSASAQQVTKAEGDVTQKTQQLEFAQQTTRQREEELYRVRSQLHNMEREDQVHKRNCAELRDALSDISPEYVLSEDSVDERSLSRVMGQAKASAQTAREDMSWAMQQSSDEATALEEKRQNVLRSMDADVKERDMTERMLQAATDRFNEATASIRALGGDSDSRRQLEQAQQEVKKLEARMEAAEELRKKGEHHLRRERITKEFETQNTRVARLRQEMARQKQRSGGQAELAALRKQLEARSADLKNGLQGVIPYITSFFIQVKPDDEFFTILSKISSASQAKKNLLTTTQDELAKLHHKGAALEQRNTTLSEQIVTQTAQLQRALVEAAEMLCRGDDGSKVEECIDTYEETVAAAKETLDAAQQKLHALAAMSACYSGFVEAARGSNHCAVCERPFDDDGEAARFISKHEEHQRTSPQAVEDAKGHIAAAQERLQRLEKARKTVEDVRQLKATLPDLEKSLKDLEKEAKNLEAFSADAASRCRTIENSVLTLNDVLMNMAQLTTVKNDMVELASHISRLEAQQQQEREAEGSDGSTAASSSKSYEELSEEYEAAIARLHKLNEQLSETQRLEDSAVDHNLGKELLDKRSAMYQLEMSISKINDLQVTLTRCEEEMASHKQRLASIQARRVELQGVLEGLEKSLHKLREARKTSERDASQKVSDAEQKLRVLESSVSRVLDYIRAENGKRLHALREQVKRAEESYNQGSAETATLLREVGEARRVVEESSRRMLEMNRVIEVLQLQRSLDADVARTTDIEKSLQELKGSKVQNVERLLGEHARTESLPRIREMIRGKISELEKMQAQQEGNVEAVLQDVNALKTQLARDKYQNVEKRYRSTFLKVQTTEIAVKDIERYYGALEKAVQSYHQEKIEQINRIISDLWRQTYRGSDIDTVEIRSESETTTASAARRSYSYRVVMKRGNHEIDMRGRCSAGQKVLASVIIRLALSEAFCCDCGILALDEPTTNLDEDNARSLAEALRVLIESRRAVKHFQLIVITHDEQFVRALGGQALDRFYYVRKDREGAFSVIEERTFDQLFA